MKNRFLGNRICFMASYVVLLFIKKKNRQVQRELLVRVHKKLCILCAYIIPTTGCFKMTCQSVYVVEDKGRGEIELVICRRKYSECNNFGANTWFSG